MGKEGKGCFERGKHGAVEVDSRERKGPVKERVAGGLKGGVGKLDPVGREEDAARWKIRLGEKEDGTRIGQLGGK